MGKSLIKSNFSETYHFNLKPDFRLKVAQNIDCNITSSDHLYQILSGRIKKYDEFKKEYYKRLSKVNDLIEKTLIKFMPIATVFLALAIGAYFLFQYFGCGL